MEHLPTITIELNSLKHTVAHMLSDRNGEINQLINEELDKALSEEWVREQIQKAVQSAIRVAIERVSGNWHVQNAIEAAISEVIIANLEKDDES